MSSLHRFARQSFAQFAIGLVATGSWLAGCGDDDDDGGDGGKGGSAGSAGSGTGGSTGGSAGSLTGGAGPTGGSSGSSTGGNAGSETGGGAGDGATGGSDTGGTGTGGTTGGTGTGGTSTGGTGMGGDGMGGEGGMGMGGDGGGDPMCSADDLEVALISNNPMQAHDHLPITGTALTTLVNMINSGTPLVFTLPTEGSNAHNHTLTFTADQLSVLRNGGALSMNVTSAMGGPANNMHTHTYSIECEP